MNTSIFGMNHSPRNRDNWSMAPQSRLTPREELEVKIRAQEMVIAGATGFPSIAEQAEKKLAELREQLRQLDEQDHQKPA